MPHALTLRLRAACLAADALAFLVSIARPIATWTEQDEEGHEITGRCVFVAPNGAASPWRLDLWLDSDNDPEGCVHAVALGWHIEVYYLRRLGATPVAV